MENQIKEKGTGLLPLPENPGQSKDFSHSVVFGATRIDQIPDNFSTGIVPVKIKDQKQLDFCAGFSSSEVSEDQEGIELDPLWQFAQIKRVMMKNGGTLESYGADLRSAGMALVTYGSIPQKISPININNERDYLANWKNWPKTLEADAIKYKKKSMFFVDGPNDIFDNIRVVLWKNKPRKMSVLVGCSWRRSWTYAPNGVIPATGWENEGGGGHALKIFDQKVINSVPYLCVQNSWGEGVGDKGVFYFPREVINSQFGPYGQIYFSDMSVNDAKYYNEINASVHDYWFVVIAKALFGAFINLFKQHGK